MDQNALNQSDCRILQLLCLKNEAMNENLIFCKIKKMIWKLLGWTWLKMLFANQIPGFLKRLYLKIEMMN